MRPHVWVYNPHKQKRTISDQTRLRVELACDTFLEKYLRPRFARPFNPKNKKDMQCVDIEWKWYRHFVHFKALYKDVRSDAREEQYDYPQPNKRGVQIAGEFYRLARKWLP